MTDLEYNIGEAAGFLHDLQEEKFPACDRWDECKADCNCYHCRIEHYAGLADRARQDAAVIGKADLERIRELRGILVDLTSDDDCQFDHHGHCQAHAWFKREPKCPHARAKEILQ